MQELVVTREQTMTREEEATGAEERELLLRHRDGDPEAFRRLVARYRAPVYSYLIRCGVADADRDDLFQDIFIKIHQAAGQYQADRPLHPWLFTIVANTVRTHFRRRRIRQILFTENPLREPKDPTPNGEQIAQAKQTARWLEKEIRALPAVERQVLVLACIESLAQKDIADALRIPLNTVKTHLRRARLTLVRKLARRHAAVKEATS
jgi:RNA polymerase sigma-70 factor (ECF subfamily)